MQRDDIGAREQLSPRQPPRAERRLDVDRGAINVRVDYIGKKSPCHAGDLAANVTKPDDPHLLTAQLAHAKPLAQA